MKQNRYWTVGAPMKPKERFSVQFLLRTQRDSEMGSILVTVSHKSQRLKFALGVHHIYLWEWDGARQRMVAGLPRSEEVNREIDRLIEVIFFYFRGNNSAAATEPSIDGLRLQLFPNRTPTSGAQPDSFRSLFKRFLREHSNGGFTQFSQRLSF